MGVRVRLGAAIFHLGHKNIIEVFMEVSGQLTCFVSVAIRQQGGELWEEEPRPPGCRTHRAASFSVWSHCNVTILTLLCCLHENTVQHISLNLTVLLLLLIFALKIP